MTYTHNNKTTEESLIDVVTFNMHPKLNVEFKDFVDSQPAVKNIYLDREIATNIMQIMGDKLDSILPSDIKNTLREMSITGEPGIIYLKGLPTDHPIPEKESIIEKTITKSKVSECLMLGLSNIMTCEVRPNIEQGSKIIHNIAPQNDYENTFSSKGTKPFYLHTDND